MYKFHKKELTLAGFMLKKFSCRISIWFNKKRIHNYNKQLIYKEQLKYLYMYI